MHVKYGFYSELAHEYVTKLRDKGYSAEQVGYASLFYETPDGRTVLVTHVSEDPEGAKHGWPDKERLGEVTRFLGIGPTMTPRDIGVTQRVELQLPTEPLQPL